MSLTDKTAIRKAVYFNNFRKKKKFEEKWKLTFFSDENRQWKKTVSHSQYTWEFRRNIYFEVIKRHVTKTGVILSVVNIILSVMILIIIYQTQTVMNNKDVLRKIIKKTGLISIIIVSITLILQKNYLKAAWKRFA